MQLILQDVNKLWERAVQELDRDEELVKFIEEKEQKQESRQSAFGRQRALSDNSYYDSVAIPEARFKIVNGVQVRAVAIAKSVTSDQDQVQAIYFDPGSD